MAPSASDIPTPALVIDVAIVRSNIERLSRYGAEHKIAIRPHTKTHKSLNVAQLQIDRGANGLTVAKAGEATCMAHVAHDLLVAYPAFDPVRAGILARLARERTVRVAVDSLLAVESLADVAAREPTTLGVLVDLDVGLGRTGVQSALDALELAQAIDRFPSLRLDGLMIYPGHVWDPPDKPSSALTEIGDKVTAVLDLWARHGLHASIVSGGSTPTAYRSHLIPNLTEIRPGTYVYNDMNTVRGGYCEIGDCAARVLCTVISTAVPNQVVLDGGSKTFTSDRCVPDPHAGFGYLVDYPQARITRLTEEHAQVDVSACERRPQLGERLQVIPNHICPCVNLMDKVQWRDGDRYTPVPVDARGALV